MAECTIPLSEQQIRLVLQTITQRADTARQVLWYSVDSPGEVLAAAAEAAATIMTSIGAIADTLSGSTVIGDADAWNHGPTFAPAGKEASHD